MAALAPATRICTPPTEFFIGDDAAWDIANIISSQSKYSNVWKVCKIDDCDYAMKVISTTSEGLRDYKEEMSIEDIQHEIAMQQLCSEIDLCPKIIDAWACENGAAIVMKKLDKTISYVGKLAIRNRDFGILKSIINRSIALVKELHKFGLAHGDCHTENIMTDVDGNMKFIDMSFARDFREIEGRVADTYFISDFQILHGSWEGIIESSGLDKNIELDLMEYLLSVFSDLVGNDYY